MRKQISYKNKPEIQFSIIVPCYNKTIYLRECLLSIVSQTLTMWEAIIVDDASTEGDIDPIIQNFSDTRFHTLHHPKNRGLSAARNTGISECCGDIIVLLDADDRLSPSYLDEISKAFVDESVDFVYTDVKLFGDETGVWKYKPFQIIDWASGQPMLGCNPFRRVIWENIGGFCEAEELRIGNEDYDFWMAVIAAGYRGIHVPIPLYEYRRTKNSMIKSLDLNFHKTIEYIASRHLTFLKNNGIYYNFLSYGYQRSTINIFKTKFYEESVPLAQFALSFGSTNNLVKHIAKFKQIPRILWPLIRLLIISRNEVSKYWYHIVQSFYNSKTFNKIINFLFLKH